MNYKINHVAKHTFLGMTAGAIAAIPIANSQAIAEETINSNIPQQLVEPSLWWKSKRLEEGWVENIDINSQTKKVIVIINPNRWSASDYLTRFSFLFRLGAEAQKHNFNLLLHDRHNRKLAEYSTQSEHWQIQPTSLGTEPFRVVVPTLFQQQF